MKPTLASLLIFIAFLQSCKQNGEKVRDQNESNNETTTCYLFTNNQDTIWMRLTEKDHEVSGTLNYLLYEKDKNTGTLTGVMKGDTLLADYKFMAEGAQSTREVIFLKKDNTFAEGYGETEERDGVMRFKSKAHIKFDTQSVLKRSDCPN